MNLTDLAQLIAARFLKEGDVAIDATVGNGHDTLFLVKQVGETGRVIGFDVQEKALDSARVRLEEEKNLIDRVRLLHLSHVEMRKGLELAKIGNSPRAIMFNLGYLPGSDKKITTEAGETLQALEISLELLEKRGILTAVLYPGHLEGRRETEAVLDWAKKLPETFRVSCTRMWNRTDAAPSLIAIEKF